MNGIGCIDARRRLQAFHDKELPIRDQIEIGAHVEDCAGCSAELGELVELRAVLRASMPGRTALASGQDASFQEAVLGRMNAEHTLSLGVRVREMFEDMHLVYAGLGAAAAAVVCAAVMLGMMPFGASQGPGSNQNPVAVNPFVRMPRAIDEPFATARAPQGDSVFMLAAVVTREGRVEHLEHLAVEHTESWPGPSDAEQAQLLQDLMGAVSKARFEPASVGAAPVAVNMVWIVAHTTVRASRVGFNVSRPSFPAAVAAAKREV